MNTFCLFENTYDTLEAFSFVSHDITYEEFSKFELNSYMTLGRRVERFFEFYINFLDEYEIIKQNIQVLNEKVTIGELDFILKNKKNKKILHIELAYKFYIFSTQEQNEIANFIGPNAHDDLSQRIEKLKEKQLPLLYKDETKKYLKDIDINKIEQKVCILANLFTPYQLMNIKFKYANNDCKIGSYINYKDFIKKDEFKDFKYFIPQKQDWLINPKYCIVWYDYEAIIKQLFLYLNEDISPLVWINDTHCFRRIFILNKNT